MVEIEIIERKANALLNRTEVRFRVTHLGAATPTRDAVREKLAAQLGSKKSLVVVDEMASTFGKGITTGIARVYEDAKALAMEPLYLLKRNKLEEHAPKKRKESAAPAAGKGKK